MKKGLLLVLFSTIALFSTAQSSFCGISNTSFLGGETLQIKMFYSAMGIYIHAGTLSIATQQKTIEGKSVYHIDCWGKTNKKYDWIFKVRDRYQTFIDTKNLNPIRFYRDVQEGSYTVSEKYYFSDAASYVKTANNKEYKLPKCTQDVVSVIFNARNIDYDKIAVGTKLYFNLFIDEELKKLYVKYLGKGKITTTVGTFNAIKLSPYITDNETLKSGESMILWLSDDGNRVPLRIESALVVGSIKADLVSYQNLRHPLTSKVH